MSDASGLSLPLIILDQDRRILVDRSGSSPALPRVQIPPFTRIAYSATRAAREKYDIELFVILSAQLKQEEANAHEADDPVLVCRLQDPTAALPAQLAWLEVKQDTLGFGTEDQLALRAANREFELYDLGAKASSFGSYRALDELRSWYEPYLLAAGVKETALQQWNGDPYFALLRIQVEPLGEATETTPRAFWFKAVGEPNTREFAVTKALTEECPYWFPKMVATKPEWNGWLMEEVSGHELDEETDGRPWALTARILAKVQKRFVGQEDRLLALGCRDWRMPRVLTALDPFFEDMEEIMARQSAEPPHILSRSELRDLKTKCQDLCRRVEDVDIPYTIAHGDFSPHNVIVTNDGWPVLIDWAEAYVSFPFISWEYFWNRMVKDHPAQAEWHERMHRNYAYRVWAQQLTQRRVDEGLRLSPSMAVLILALYGIDDPEQRQNRRADKVKRSLVRRLHRELEILEPVGAL
jgi:Phosphotransferase enzyme family